MDKKDEQKQNDVSGSTFTSDDLLSAIDKGLEDKMKEHYPHFTQYGCKADDAERYIISKTLYQMYADMRDILREVKGR